jgi:hypothetical protein
VDDIYFGTLLNNSADKYGSKANKDFTKAVSDSTKKVVSESFNKTSLGYSESEDSSNGITVKSWRAMNLLRVAKDEGFTSAIGKLAKQGVQEGDRYFVISSSAKYSDSFTNEDINLLLLKSIDGLKLE